MVLLPPQGASCITGLQSLCRQCVLFRALWHTAGASCIDSFCMQFVFRSSRKALLALQHRSMPPQLPCMVVCRSLLALHARYITCL